jgi:hypothetical protein
MRKQGRRLWFGDWQHGDPDEAATDTFVIRPDEGEDAPATPDRRRNARLGAILAAIAVFVVAVFALTSGGGDKPATSERSDVAPAQAPQVLPQPPQAPQGAPPQGFGGADLTGPEATKAARAALMKFPGDIERVTRDSTGGGYVVHVIQSDGNEVHVLVDGDFHVQGSDAGRGPGPLGPGTSQ